MGVWVWLVGEVVDDREPEKDGCGHCPDGGVGKAV